MVLLIRTLPMCRRPFHRWFLALIIPFGIVTYWLLTGWGSPDPTDREAMLGTWTDPAGEPGNSVRFYFVPVDLPGPPLMQAYEGHVTVVGLLGEKKAEAVWNCGTWDPLVLNVTVGTTAWFAVVRKLDRDHILIRFGRDPAEIMEPGAIDHPDTKRLTRIGAE